jgi:hypothetical protein
MSRTVLIAGSKGKCGLVLSEPTPFTFDAKTGIPHDMGDPATGIYRGVEIPDGIQIPKSLIDLELERGKVRSARQVVRELTCWQVDPSQDRVITLRESAVNLMEPCQQNHIRKCVFAGVVKLDPKPQPRTKREKGK